MCQHPGAYWFFAGDYLNKAKASHEGPYKSVSVRTVFHSEKASPFWHTAHYDVWGDDSLKETSELIYDDLICSI